VPDSHDVPHAGATRLPVVVIVAVGRGPSPLRTLLPPPVATLGALPSALDGASLPLLGVASLLPEGRQNAATSLLVVYWTVTLCSSSVVNLKMSLRLPLHRSCVRHSGHTLVSPWPACRRVWGSVCQPHRHNRAWSKK
jgi:hypothetical protein